MNRRVVVSILAGTALATLIAGLLLPERLIIPVAGATRADWNANTFWCRPWGQSGVHRGIDIFARKGTLVLASSPGVVLFAGRLRDGGNVAAVLGPKWRVHYYAHLQTTSVANGQLVTRGDEIGTVGATGNAAGKPPHLHYAIITQLPYPWRYKPERFGVDRMFYLNPHELLVGAATDPPHGKGRPVSGTANHFLLRHPDRQTAT